MEITLQKEFHNYLMVTYLILLLHGNASTYKEPLCIRFVIYYVADNILMHKTPSPQVFMQHVVKQTI